MHQNPVLPLVQDLGWHILGAAVVSGSPGERGTVLVAHVSVLHGEDESLHDLVASFWIGFCFGIVELNIGWRCMRAFLLGLLACGGLSWCWLLRCSGDGCGLWLVVEFAC